ncbi:MAG TPA: YihY/virulence factor BrkB family protein [bacterium]|nr:YihY/virulence factor BrkB family protein [bacterium]HMW33885.1 YihY/virulence factor BrkB family protein [bacterium]HMW35038.1 YihY/virulence factor BrkB family protein [bacterium]HMY36839.1 YihY/virulence factor BrkB family protein [bacterium]HMZ04332.1 YihY/virulence factor BrkB family protein [bacterium]
MKKSTITIVKKFRRFIIWWIEFLGWLYKTPVIYYLQQLQQRIFDRHKLTTNAAAISFFFLLSIIPLLFIVLSIIASFVQSPEEAQAYISETLTNRVPDTARDFVLQLIQKSNLTESVTSILENKGWISLVSIGSLLWTSSGAFAAIEDAMSTIFGVRGRNYFVSRLVEMGMVVLIGCLFLLSSLISGIIHWLQENHITFFQIDFSNLPYVWDIITNALPYVLIVLTFYVTYKILPKTEIYDRAAMLGALVASVLLELTLYGFSYYVQNFARYNVFYGSVAGVVISVFTIYLASIILLVGAEITEIANTRLENERELAQTIREFES